MLDKYLETQRIATILLKKEIETNKLVQAYIFYLEDMEYLMSFAKDFAKEIICDGKDEKINKEIDNNTYLELKIIEPEGNFIKKEQLLELQNDVKNKPVLGKKIVYILKHCERLNQSSANSILKFLEEPADDIIAILLTDNISNVIPTIKSRCQIINLNKVNDRENKTSLEYLYSILYNSEIDEESFESILQTTLKFINEIENKKINVFINEKSLLFDKLSDNISINIFFNMLIYFYMDVLYKVQGSQVKYYYDYIEDIENVLDKNNVNQILNKIYIVENIKNEIMYNVNSKLLFDKLIIEVGEV